MDLDFDTVDFEYYARYNSFINLIPIRELKKESIK